MSWDNTVVKATNNDAIWDWDILTDKVFMVGDTYKQLFCYDIVNACLPGDFWESIIHPEDRERVLGKLSALIPRGWRRANGRMSTDLKKKNGQYAYVHDRGYIIYSSGTSCPIRMIGASPGHYGKEALGGDHLCL